MMPGDKFTSRPAVRNAYYAGNIGPSTALNYLQRLGMTLDEADVYLDNNAPVSTSEWNNRRVYST